MKTPSYKEITSNKKKNNRIKWQVYHKYREHTNGKLRSEDLIKNKRNKIVSKCKHKQSKNQFDSSLCKQWNKAFMRAREDLHIEHFVLCRKNALYKLTYIYYLENRLENL